MTILATVTVVWQCAFWVPRVEQLKPLLCQPRTEIRMRALDASTLIQQLEEEGPTRTHAILDLQWDEKDQLKQSSRTVRWKPELK